MWKKFAINAKCAITFGTDFRNLEYVFVVNKIFLQADKFPAN